MQITPKKNNLPKHPTIYKNPIHVSYKTFQWYSIIFRRIDILFILPYKSSRSETSCSWNTSRTIVCNVTATKEKFVESAECWSISLHTTVRKEGNICVPRSWGSGALEIGIASRRVSAAAFYRSVAAAPLATPEQTVKSFASFRNRLPTPAGKHCSILRRVVILLFHRID